MRLTKSSLGAFAEVSSGMKSEAFDLRIVVDRALAQSAQASSDCFKSDTHFGACID